MGDPMELAEQRKRAVSALFELPEGREFLRWLLQIGQVDRQPATGNALSTHFNCGQLNVGLQIKELVEAAVPGGAAKLMKENVV